MSNQGNYRYSQKYIGTKSRLQNALSKKDYEILLKFESDMIVGALGETRRVKILDSIWACTKLLEDGQEWKCLLFGKELWQ